MFIHTYTRTDMYWYIAVDYYTLFTLLTFGGHHHQTDKHTEPYLLLQMND